MIISLKKCLKILLNEGTGNFHNYLMKWLTDTKKEKKVLHMLSPRKHCLDDSKFYSDVTEKGLLAWNQNKQFTYYIFHIPIPNSALNFLTIAQVCYQQISILDAID